jgi:hypothetical protein
MTSIEILSIDLLRGNPPLRFSRILIQSIAAPFSLYILFCSVYNRYLRYNTAFALPAFVRKAIELTVSRITILSPALAVLEMSFLFTFRIIIEM